MRIPRNTERTEGGGQGEGGRRRPSSSGDLEGGDTLQPTTSTALSNTD